MRRVGIVDPSLAGSEFLVSTGHAEGYLALQDGHIPRPAVGVDRRPRAGGEVEHQLHHLGQGGRVDRLEPLLKHGGRADRLPERGASRQNQGQRNDDGRQR